MNDIDYNKKIDFIIDEIERMQKNGQDLLSVIETTEALIEFANINEARDIEKITSKLTLELLDIDKFVRVNNCDVVTNPIFYYRPGEPTDDGLLSNRIFGITPDDKAGVFAYIDLNKYFLNPACYKAWYTIDSKIKDCIAKTKTFSLDRDGYTVEDPRGSNGIEFLKKNIQKIKFRYSEGTSIKRDIRAKFLDLNRNSMFINKYLVIPVFYRDTNSKDASKGTVGVSKINRLYQQLILSANHIKDTQEYGFDMSGSLDFRLQETLLQIYDWFCGNNNKNILKTEAGFGIKRGKFGVLRTANQSKTSDYAARLVITSAELKANTPANMKVDFDKSMIPLSAAIAAFAPFVRFTVRRFFEREFAGTEQYPVYNKNGVVEYKAIKDPFIQFSDERITTEMEQFIHGYNNRLIPVKVQLEDGTEVSMQFKGSYKPIKSENEVIYNRRLTWLDVLYICTKEATKNKMVLMSRFPIDTRTNQITSEIDISTTNETEPMYIENDYYPFYPKFRDSDIGKDTSNMFIDTLVISNLYTGGLGADFDGDQMTVKGVFTDEANEELREFKNSKKNFIGFGGKNIRSVDGDVVQSLYNLTKILDEDKKKLSLPVF